MILFKSCGRCAGDVHVDASPYGVEVFCLQCGSRRFLMPGDMESLVRSARSPSVPVSMSDRAA